MNGNTWLCPVENNLWRNAHFFVGFLTQHSLANKSQIQSQKYNSKSSNLHLRPMQSIWFMSDKAVKSFLSFFNMYSVIWPCKLNIVPKVLSPFLPECTADVALTMHLLLQMCTNHWWYMIKDNLSPSLPPRHRCKCVCVCVESTALCDRCCCCHPVPRDVRAQWKVGWPICHVWTWSGRLLQCVHNVYLLPQLFFAVNCLKQHYVTLTE